MASYAKFDVWQNTQGITWTTVKQVVSISSSATQGSTSTTYAQYTPINLSIVPYFNTSKIMIMFWSQVYHSANTGIHISIRKNGTSLINSDTISYYMGHNTNPDYRMMPIFFQYLDTPNSTISQDYTVFMRSDTGEQVWINRPQNQTYTSRSGVTGTTTLSLMEIAQ